MNDDKLAVWQRWGIALLRVTVGFVFLMHGAQAASAALATLGSGALSLESVLRRT